MPPVWISFLESKGSGKLGKTDDAGQSSVLTSVRQVQDSRPESSVEDSVGQTISFTEVGLEKSIEEDGRVRPRSVNLLGDSRVIDSEEQKPGDVREEDGRCRPKDQGKFKGRVYGLLRSRALIKLRGSEEDQGKEQLTVGADPSASFQVIPRGGHFAHPVGPGSGFQGRGGWGQSHDRQIGFPWAPQDGHHAYAVGPVSGYHDDRQVGFPQGAPQDWHHAYTEGPGSGFPSMEGWQFQGVPRQRARPYDRPWRGGMGVVHHGRGVQRGPCYLGVPRVGPNYGNRGGSGGALQSGVPSVVSGRRGTEAVGGIPLGRWSWLCCDWSHGGTGLRDAKEARAELCKVEESRPWYLAGDSK